MRQDIVSIKAAQGVDFARLQRDVRKIEEGIEIANRLIPGTDQAGGKANEKLQTFLQEASFKLEAATKKNVEAKEAFHQLCLYFGEDTKSTPRYLFGILDDFLQRIAAETQKRK